MENNLQALAAKTAIVQMLKGKHFSICAVDRAAELIGSKTGNQAYKTLYALHCIDFAEMPQELRNAIPDLVSEALSVPHITMKEVPTKEMGEARQKPSFLQIVGLK